MIRTPNLSTTSNASSMQTGNGRNSTFYVDLPHDGGGGGGVSGGGSQNGANGSVFMISDGLRTQGRFESIDTFSDISDLGAAKVTPPRLNVETISNFSQISDLMMNTKIDRTDSTTDTKSLGSLRFLMDQTDDTNSSHKNIPNMRKANFQFLWRSLVEIIGDQDEDMSRACKYMIECIYNIEYE